MDSLLSGAKTQTRRIAKEFNGLDVNAVLKRFPNQSGCPYGEVGDHLWVRESDADIGPRRTYRADQDDGAHCQVKKWTPSIHMFRAHSRILLEIVSVRVERLNDCSEADALAEGINADLLGERQGSYDVVCAGTDAGGRATARPMYRELWESIDGAGTWAANPFFWVVTFRRQ